MVEKTASELKLDPQELRLIESQVDDHIDKKELNSIAPETSLTPITDEKESLLCGKCHKVPVNPVQEENCEQYFCIPCLEPLQK